MRAIIHIGLAKTGSTSIQRLLKLNREGLEQRGYALRYDTRELLDYGRGMDTAIHLGDDRHTLIYSDERLSSRLTSQEQVDRVIALLRQHADDIRIIVYVRRQDEVFVSAYNSMLMAGETRKLSEIETVPLQRPFKQLRRWEKAIGRSQLVIRRFGTEYLRKGLLRDFCKHCGLDPMNLQLPESANVSPGADVLELMRQFNIRFPQHPHRRRILKIISLIQGTAAPAGLARDLRLQIDLAAQPDDAHVAERYLGGGPLFQHLFLDDPIPDVTLTPDQVVRLIQGASNEQSFGTPPPPTGGLDVVLDWIATYYQERIARQDEMQLISHDFL